MKVLRAHDYQTQLANISQMSERSRGILAALGASAFFVYMRRNRPAAGPAPCSARGSAAGSLHPDLRPAGLNKPVSTSNAVSPHQ